MNNNETKVEDVQSSSTKPRVTSQEEQDWWDALYMYVKNDILELDPKLHLNRYTVLRLRGMAQGYFVGQKREQCDLTYGYRVVLAAFSKMAPLIKYGFQTKTFNNLQQVTTDKLVYLKSGEDPRLGFDNFGNIVVEENTICIPKGGWSDRDGNYYSETPETGKLGPINIFFLDKVEFSSYNQSMQRKLLKLLQK